MVETSYIELCFVLPVFLQNLHNCFFLSRLLIPYYTTVFRDQIKACIAGTSHVIKQHTKPTGHRHSIFYFTYVLLFRYSESTCFLYFCLEMSKQLVSWPWISCDTCQTWYHYNCVQTTHDLPSEEEFEGISWVCLFCC